MDENAKMQYCDYCGDEIGAGHRYYRERMTCGKHECERWARGEEQDEREQAHEELDRNMGWR